MKATLLPRENISTLEAFGTIKACTKISTTRLGSLDGEGQNHTIRGSQARNYIDLVTSLAPESRRYLESAALFIHRLNQATRREGRIYLKKTSNFYWPMLNIC